VVAGARGRSAFVAEMAPESLVAIGRFLEEWSTVQYAMAVSSTALCLSLRRSTGVHAGGRGSVEGDSASSRHRTSNLEGRMSLKSFKGRECSLA
jgi:hypothetical protein